MCVCDNQVQRCPSRADNTNLFVRQRQQAGRGQRLTEVSGGSRGVRREHAGDGGGIGEKLGMKGGVGQVALMEWTYVGE